MKALKKFGPGLVILILMLCAGYAAGRGFSVFPKGHKPNGFLFLLLTIIAIFSTLAIHELGHLLTGLAQGFRFELFVVGLLGIKRENNKVKIYLNKDIGMMGGIAATVPVQQSPDNRKKFARMVIAGPAASLLFGIVAFLLTIYCTSGAGRGFWMVSGACSLGLVLATTLPSKSGIFFTDRARFQRLISKGEAGAIEEAMLSLIAQSTIDNSAKNIDLNQARLLQTDDEAFMRFWGYYYEYQYYKDNRLQNETDAAKQKLVAVKGDMSPAVWKALQIDEPTPDAL
ncbi:M50 family peptidase [Mucilaginibacter terrigena]|uniref:M50 family peptidase n=1 Tax=Mucilaginibacter terrigena TaxID=2492395 RepID=A0A4Q5LRJ2_9SPHI|nr:M50 family metallopeptidase [Mucilaginibacter terrigena]RYU92067.1 M50 family peptidase [Mucilaginibacter terrigena]